MVPYRLTRVVTRINAVIATNGRMRAGHRIGPMSLGPAVKTSANTSRIKGAVNSRKASGTRRHAMKASAGTRNQAI